MAALIPSHARGGPQRCRRWPLHRAGGRASTSSFARTSAGGRIPRTAPPVFISRTTQTTNATGSFVCRPRPYSSDAAVASPSACFAGGLASSLSFTRRRRHHLLISHAQRPLRPSKVLEADGDERHRVVADELAGRSSSACALRPVRGSEGGGNKAAERGAEEDGKCVVGPNVESC